MMKSSKNDLIETQLGRPLKPEFISSFMKHSIAWTFYSFIRNHPLIDNKLLHSLFIMELNSFFQISIIVENLVVNLFINESIQDFPFIIRKGKYSSKMEIFYKKKIIIHLMLVSSDHCLRKVFSIS